MDTLTPKPTSLCVVDPESLRIVWANSAAIRIWGEKNVESLYAKNLKESLSEAGYTLLLRSASEGVENSLGVKNACVESTGLPLEGTLIFSPIQYGSINNAILMHITGECSDKNLGNEFGITALNTTCSYIFLYNEKFELLYSNPSAQATIPEGCTNLETRLVNDTDIFMMEEALEISDTCCMELEVKTPRGPRWHNMTLQKTTQSPSGDPVILMTSFDATERRHAQQVAYKLAYTDSLTGLPNRAALSIFLDEMVGASEEGTVRFGLFFLDLDRFKLINDSLGHAVGDQLLIEVAHRLKKSVGAHGMVSRLGGDEFVMVINMVSETGKLQAIANDILSAMGPPAHLGGQKLRISPSIGICRYPDDGSTVAEIMECADSAMYLAKSHQSGFCFYDRKMLLGLSETFKERLELENDLVIALEKEQFELYYQPKISSKTLKVTGVEALIRWNHPTRGLVAPDEFISIAEETGHIIELGQWVLETAMTQQRHWKESGIRIIVAINISVRQFQDNDLATKVSEAIVKTGCDPTLIELEITESMLLGEAEKVHEALQKLSAMQVKLALDDFGTGYSNLAYLQKYPLDTLKIDRIFLEGQPYSMLMDTILNMGRVLGLYVVAEGVETKEQAEWLIAHGCDQLQGFYYSRPLPVEQATQYLLANGHSQTLSHNKAA